MHQTEYEEPGEGEARAFLGGVEPGAVQVFGRVAGGRSRHYVTGGPRQAAPAAEAAAATTAPDDGATATAEDETMHPAQEKDGAPSVSDVLNALRRPIAFHAGATLPEVLPLLAALVRRVVTNPALQEGSPDTSSLFCSRLQNSVMRDRRRPASGRRRE